MNKQAILDVLNSLQVIEKEGGEDGYILVKNNEEVAAKLNAVGVTNQIIESYSEEDVFCIASMAAGEKYADDYVNGKFILWDKIDDDLRYRVIEGRGTARDAYRLLKELEPELNL